MNKPLNDFLLYPITLEQNLATLFQQDYQILLAAAPLHAVLLKATKYHEIKFNDILNNIRKTCYYFLHNSVAELINFCLKTQSF